MAYLSNYSLGPLDEDREYRAATNSYLELWRFSDARHNIIREGSLPDNKLLDEFLDQHEYDTESEQQYPFQDEAVMTRVWEKLMLPKGFLRAWGMLSGVCWATRHIEDDGDFIHLALAHPWSCDFWSLATSYNVRTRVTTHVLGYVPGSDVKDVVTNLKAAINIAHHPLVVPMCVYAASVTAMIGVDERTRGCLIEVDSAIGLNHSPAIMIDEEAVSQLRGNFQKLNETLVSAQSGISNAWGWRVFFPQVSKTMQRAVCACEAVAESHRGLGLKNENIKDWLDMLDQEREYRESLFRGYDSQIRLLLSVAS
ncbi:hypothetical protein GP486_004983 [Trichoglossum hirsutum]|uniref:Uncharacterized protein n=1 Tax=Trichoglossum hirsutum TaxID=265104 RepID=A0A9P8LA44_9PEZI|nr:hypothetical protein GP486_004983 [Trichoglossum hirsutum]